jgi:AraC-like DNA-binding protein
VLTLRYDYPSGHFIRPHAHDRHQLVYASEGVMTVQTPEGSWVVPAHRAVWIPCGVVHSIRISGRVSMRTLYLAPRIDRSLPSSCYAFAVSPLLRELVLHAVEKGSLDRRVAAEAHLIAVILGQLGPVQASPLQLPLPRDPRALRMARRLQERPGDRRPVRALLARAGASQRTLERLFRAETGLSLGRWRQQLRLFEALRLLAAGEPVTAVALDVGYESLSAFVSVFRRTFGATPGRYFR